jgi:hypothetical protein
MTKPAEAYAKDIQQTFELIQFNNKFKPIVMGSNASSLFEYAHDYDLFNVVDVSMDMNALKKVFVRGIKNLFANLSKNKDTIYFIEFMCGSAIVDNDTTPLRWSMKEVKLGTKIVNGTSYNLFDVLNEKSVIKLEIVKYIDGTFTPISNVYEFRIKHKGVNREKETRDDIDSLKVDIKKYHDKKNYMKVLKRLYIIAIQSKDKKMKDKLEELFNSNIGALYKIKSELETMLDVLSKSRTDKTTISRCQQAIQRLKESSSKLSFEFPTSFYESFDKASSKTGAKSMIKSLSKLIVVIDKKVQKDVKTYMNVNKINYTKYLS